MVPQRLWGFSGTFLCSAAKKKPRVVSGACKYAREDRCSWPSGGNGLVDDAIGLLEVDRDERGDAALDHGDAVEPVHLGHGDAVMGDDQEARVAVAGDLVHQVAEALHVGVVERRIDL